MATVLSRDGTPIAFDRSGDGPPVILVLGAFNDRPVGVPLATHLAAHFTVYNYDRRGRGERETQPRMPSSVRSNIGEDADPVGAIGANPKVVADLDRTRTSAKDAIHTALDLIRSTSAWPGPCGKS